MLDTGCDKLQRMRQIEIAQNAWSALFTNRWLKFAPDFFRHAVQAPILEYVTVVDGKRPQLSLALPGDGRREALFFA